MSEEKLTIEDRMLLNNAISLVVDSTKSLYKELDTGILELAYVQKQIKMNKEQILKLHKEMFNYWQGKNGKWYSYLPKEGVAPPKGKQIESICNEKLNKAIISHYLMEVVKKQKKSNPIFNDVYWKWRDIHNRRLADSSINRYDGDFPRFFECSDFGHMSIDKITENTIEAYIMDTIKERKLSMEGLKDLVMYIQKTFKYARREKIILENPADIFEVKDFSALVIRNEKPLDEKQYSDEDVSQMLAFLKEEYSKQPKYMALYAIELAILTGMRVGELSGLKWEDISEESIHIRRSLKYKPSTKEYYIDDVKNRRPRYFPLDETIIDLLSRIKEVYVQYGGLCDWVFAIDGDYINTRIISSCNKNKCRQLGGKAKSGIHGYRHRLSSNLRTKGIADTVVAYIMGHSVQTNNKHYNRNTATVKEMSAIISEEHKKLSL